jgi:hypothetical protein
MITDNRMEYETLVDELRISIFKRMSLLDIDKEIIDGR